MKGDDKPFPEWGPKTFWAGEFHKEFIDLMHGEFDTSHPGYSVIVFDPDLTGSRFYMKTKERTGTIVIGYRNKPLEEFKDYNEYIGLLFSIYHESSHTLHNGIVDFPRKGHLGISFANYSLREVIADFASLIAVEKTKPNYVLGDLFRLSCPGDWSGVALELFTSEVDNSDFLRKISKMQMKQARPLMLDILERNYLFWGEREEQVLKDL